MEDTTKVVVIKRYNNPSEAYIDAGLLEANGIDCGVDGSTASSMLPYLQVPVSLVVNQKDVAAALELVPGSAVEE